MATEFNRPRRQRRVTLADVADAAGVSPALASIVMRGVSGASDATRQRVQQAAEELGYVPDRRAQKLRQIRSGLVGACFELHQPFHGDLIEQLYVAVADHGFDLSLSCITPSRDEHTAVGDLMRERCEAAILLGSRMTSEELGALSARIPTHVIARGSGSPLVGSVSTDDTAGITIAVDHLVSLGHRRILHVTGGDAPGGTERAIGFTTRMAHHGLADLALLLPGGPTETAGAEAITEALLFDHQPTAVVAFNDRCAIGVLEVLRQRSVHVPEDVSVIGYDDSRLSRLSHISMSTIAQDVSRIATETMASVTAQIAGNPPSQTVLAPRLIARDTTGPAPSIPGVSKPGTSHGSHIH
jgi:LacI family transcriptional regulator